MAKKSHRAPSKEVASELQINWSKKSLIEELRTELSNEEEAEEFILDGIHFKPGLHTESKMEGSASEKHSNQMAKQINDLHKLNFTASTDLSNEDLVNKAKIEILSAPKKRAK